MRIRFLLALILAVLSLARATTVIPPSFAELVSGADAIYRGEVKNVESRRVVAADGTNLIKTFVTFAVERTLKGPAQDEVVLEFLGGTVGDESLTVAGMPKFKPGDREFVFTQKNGIQFCPLVAMMHGRYRVLHDAAAGRDYVARDNRAPLTDVTEIQLPMTTLPATVQAATAGDARARAFTPAAFETQIMSQAQKLPPIARPN